MKLVYYTLRFDIKILKGSYQEQLTIKQLQIPLKEKATSRLLFLLMESLILFA